MLYTICYLLFAPMITPGNDSIPAKKIIFKTTVSTIGASEARGYLSSINDSTVEVASNKVHTGFNEAPGSSQTFHYTELGKIKFRKKNATGHGLLVGAIAGLTVGVIASAPAGDKSGEGTINPLGTGGAAVARGATIGMVSGAIIGGILGSLATKRFVIKGKKERMLKAHNYIQRRLAH